MSIHKKQSRKPVRRQSIPSAGGRAVNGRLNELAEQIEIMIPEMTARIAALEHLLLEKHLCTREELVGAREFVRILED